MEKSTILSTIQQNYQNLSKEHSYIQDAVKFLEKVLIQNYESTFVSFNGGKDATIVLVLTYLALNNLKHDKSFTQKHKINQGIKVPEGIYFQQPNPFPEMQNFYQEMVKIFGLKMHKLYSKKYPQELTCFSSKHHMTGIIMGSRNDDPYCENLDLITQSDTQKGYPKFNRINPIIRWNYEKVWTAIKVLDIPYCSLYEQGYSSIGNKNNTVKNPTLVTEGNRCLKPFEANPETQRICRVNGRK